MTVPDRADTTGWPVPAGDELGDAGRVTRVERAVRVRAASRTVGVTGGSR
ncbi:hypothetical protein WIS52_19840 [Pseudonocardia nematodicida]|uniref:Uncharacterized protein n=1 Tax=Pseudonocardia nematodicida TaxID=1206997 RepID=A0ABV1KE36_9PSEU